MDLLTISWPTLSPALTRAVEPFCTFSGFPHLAAHFPLALASVAFWVGLHFGSILLTPYIYAPYKQLPKRTRIQWHVHLVALVHATIITPLAAAQWYLVRQDGGLQGGSHPLATNRTYGYTVEAGNVYAVALGYFAWDVVVSALFDGPAFIAHGVVAMVAFTFVYHPIFMYDGLGFLLWELSTPFLNIHWFLDKMGKTGSTAQLVNAGFLLSSYVLARLTFGVYNSFSWFKHVNFPPTPHVPAIPIGLKLFYSVGNVTLNTLNFVWFRAMIAAVQKRFTAAPTTVKKGTGEKDGKEGPFSGSYSGEATEKDKKIAQKADRDAQRMAGVSRDSGSGSGSGAATSTAKSAKEAIQWLAEQRRRPERQSAQVVEYGTYLLEQGYAKTLGDDLWSFLEQVAMAAMDVGNWELAELCLARLNTRFPKSTRVGSLQGMLYEAQGQNTRALHYYNELIEAAEGADIMLSKRRIAVLKAMEGSGTAKAIEALIKHLEIFYSDPEGWQELAALYSEQGQYAKAASALEELMLLVPQNGFYVLQYAETLYTAGEYATAYKAFLRVLDMGGVLEAPAGRGGGGGTAGGGTTRTESGPEYRALYGLRATIGKLREFPKKAVAQTGAAGAGVSEVKAESIDAIEALVEELIARPLSGGQ